MKKRVGSRFFIYEVKKVCFFTKVVISKADGHVGDACPSALFFEYIALGLKTP